jgi:hypothetical protein
VLKQEKSGLCISVGTARGWKLERFSIIGVVSRARRFSAWTCRFIALIDDVIAFHVVGAYKAT